MANKRQAAKVATRAAILAAAGAVFDKHGYEAATIRLIAKTAGFSTGAIFSNWEDKAALWREAKQCTPPADGALFRCGPGMLAVLEAYLEDHACRAARGETDACERDLFKSAEAIVRRAKTPLPFEPGYVEPADAG